VKSQRVLRRIFELKKDGVTGDWRKLHNEEVNDLYTSPNIVRVIKSSIMRSVRNAARMGESRGVYRLLVDKTEGMRSLGRPWHGWEDNIKWLFKKWDVFAWT
jgi:hypothetical protein